MSKFNIETERIKHHFFTEFVSAVINENTEIKTKLEKDDLYQEYIAERAKSLLDEALSLREKNKLSIIEAINIVQTKFKTKIANE